MRRLGTWAVAGALAGALTILFMVVMSQSGMPGYVTPVLNGSAGLHLVLTRVCWGAAYGLCFFVLAQHFLPAAVLTSSLGFSPLPFLATVLLLPLYFGDPVTGGVSKLAVTALNCVFYSVLMVWLGRQLEK